MNINFRNISIRLTLRDDAPSGTPLELPRQNRLIPTLIVVALFVAFAAVWVQQASKLNLHALGSVFDLMGMLFSLFWLLGWSVAVILLALLVVFLVFFGDSARVVGGRVVYVMNIGPFKMIGEYELTRMLNLRAEADASGERAKVQFEYEGVGCALGDLMPLHIAKRNVEILRRAMDGVVMVSPTEFEKPPEFSPAQFEPPADVAQRRLPLISMLVLVGANLIPLLAVLLGGWTLAEVMVLFWAESAVIGFYTLLKIAVVAKWFAPFPGVFFMGHFGGFMAIHFMFIHMMFVRGMNAKAPDPSAIEALSQLFVPLWPALLALLVSHGVSFVLNFIGHREYEGATVQRLMMAPYGRIVVMQFTLILGGWVVMLLKDPMPALVLLVVIKVIADLRAHYGERASSSDE